MNKGAAVDPTPVAVVPCSSAGVTYIALYFNSHYIYLKNLKPIHPSLQRENGSGHFPKNTVIINVTLLSEVSIWAIFSSEALKIQ